MRFASRLRAYGRTLPSRMAAVRGYLFVALVCQSYLVPIAVNACSRDYFAYHNAWDEEYYLSYQGAIASRTLPGFFTAAHLVQFGHWLGLSGAWQNLLLDLFVPLIMVFALAAVLRARGLDTQNATLYAAITTFGLILFNRANPLVYALVKMDFPFLAPAYEAYQSILRSPNPQVSYLLLSFGLLAAYRLKKLWPLILPLPFLYWAVGIGHLYLMSATLLYRRFLPTTESKRWVIALGSAAALGLVAFATFNIIGLTFPLFAKSPVMTPFSQPMVSVAMGVGALAYLAICAMEYRREPLFAPPARFGVTVAMVSLLFVTNIQVFTRIRLAPKDMQDYFAGFVAAGLLAAALYAFRLHVSRRTSPGWLRFAAPATTGLLCALIVALSMTAQGFSPLRLQYRVFINRAIAADDVARIEADPLHALIPSRHAAQKLSLMAPHMLAPVFSNVYSFSPVNSSCFRTPDVHERAIAFVREKAKTERRYADVLGVFEEAYAAYKTREAQFSLPYRNVPEICAPESFDGNDFFLVPVEGEEMWATFP
ncbi:MAG: hypothetical protein HQK87_05225 [Nitrospinae bacterium]|nr:hypothetical protein [Nitrospinota bacterium]